MANKPVKFLTDLSTRRSIYKTDQSGEVRFDVSGSNGTGFVSSSYPITGAAGFLGDLYGSASYAHEAYTYTSGAIDGTGLPNNPVYLKDPLIIGTITASQIYAPEITGTLHGTASFALNAANAAIADEVQNAYTRLRFQQVGYFNVDGSKIIALPAEVGGLASFPTESLDFINITVHVKDNNKWKNDILSVESYISGTNIVIELSAPALDDTSQYKLLAINENPADFMVI
jgi:hypothetical protein